MVWIEIYSQQKTLVKEVLPVCYAEIYLASHKIGLLLSRKILKQVQDDKLEHVQDNKLKIKSYLIPKLLF